MTAWPADIEVVLRRVVREEIRDALAGTATGLVAAPEPANGGPRSEAYPSELSVE